jgi:hypothetical protein
MPVCHLL